MLQLFGLILASINSKTRAACQADFLNDPSPISNSRPSERARESQTEKNAASSDVLDTELFSLRGSQTFWFVQRSLTVVPFMKSMINSVP